MAEYTPNINLYKKDPVRDANDTFNIQTMLNENWDKIDSALGDTTTPANKVGLTGDLSVGASLGVLATAGDLHVWRRTVTTEEGIDPSYNLGNDRTSVKITNETSSYNASITITYGDSVSVSMNGVVSIDSPQTKQMSTNPVSNPTISGPKFFSITSVSNLSLLSGIRMNDTYYIPGGYSLRLSGNNPFYFEADKLQDVTGVPAVPPGTYTDYPVSVNPNAYQEGSDAQPAGYTLGAVQNGEFNIAPPGNSSSYGTSVWEYSESIFVSDDGLVNLVSPTSISIRFITDSGSLKQKFIGKFARITSYGSPYSGPFSIGNIYFIPEDASITKPGGAYSVSQYQTVTGYPAIPAGTTIEYMGKLGDKARIVTGSYVGTGTYGSSSPTKVKISPSPKFAIISPANLQNSGRYSAFIVWCFGSTSASSVMSDLDNSQKISVNYSDGYFSWYGSTANYQLNESGTSYVYTFFM